MIGQRNHSFRHYLPVLITSTLALVLYLNTLDADLVYDDSRAVITNQDLRPETPWHHLLVNDFWGTALRHTGSHKSYRPLTVATLRLNYYFHELRPYGYHLVNVVLHAVVTGLVASLASRLSNGDTVISWCCGLVFSAHPIHTEAVSSVVGRADLLAALFVLLSVHCYIAMMDWDSAGGSCKFSLITNRAITVVAFLFLVIQATLSKEHGFTVLGVCLLYDIALTARAGGGNPSPSIQSPQQHQNHRSIDRQQQPAGKRWASTQPGGHCCSLQTPCALHFRQLLTEWLEIRWRSIRQRATYWTFARWSIVIIFGLVLIVVRLWLMGFTAPSFSPSDNPAAHADHLLTRLMTFTYLATFNIFLLFCPSTLSFDWSMDAIPLIERVYDHRNILSFTVFITLTFLLLHINRCLISHTVGGDTMVKKATNCKNRHFYDMVDINGNACFLEESTGWTNQLSPGAIGSVQCTIRNCQTKSSYNSTYKTKFRGRHLDLGTSSNLVSSNQVDSSADLLASHKMACDEIRTALMGLLLAVVTFLPASNIFFHVGFVVAERILYLPSVGFSLLIAVGCNRLWRFCTRRLRIALATCGLFTLVVFCGKTVLRNGDWLNEERLYSSGIVVNPAKAYSNLGNVFAQRGLADQAALAYRAALSHRPNMADTHYNYGILLQERGDWKTATAAYENAIKFRPRMALAYLNLGIALTSMQRQKEAEQCYLSCANLSVEGLKDPKAHQNAKLSCLFNLGRLYADQNRYSEAIGAYRLAVDRLNPYYQPHSLYNALGDALSRIGHLAEAEEAFKLSLGAKPDHAPVHLTYGHFLAKTGRKEEALLHFNQATAVSPSDSIVWQHVGQFYADSGELGKAAQAFDKARRLNTGNFEATFGLANAYRNLGRNDFAEEFYGKAVLLRPKSANARMNFGAILHLNKKWAEAEREYLQALKLDPLDEMTKENLRKLRRSALMNKKT